MLRRCGTGFLLLGSSGEKGREDEVAYVRAKDARMRVRLSDGKYMVLSQ